MVVGKSIKQSLPQLKGSASGSVTRILSPLRVAGAEQAFLDVTGLRWGASLP